MLFYDNEEQRVSKTIIKDKLPNRSELAPFLALEKSGYSYQLFYQLNYRSWWYSYLPTPLLGQDMTQGQFLSRV